ncbi:MAG: ATP-binding cassette domain-containing protein, partial [Spirochaetales bacterium]|nr:ATP-binding cassette domain-containing protein [Spirochaetales bacterium]
KSYGNFSAVKDASFCVQPGEIVGLLGPNGAGKTSIMKILTGYHFPSGGTARLGGWDVRTNPVEVKAVVGYLPENAPVYSDFSVEEYLSFVAESRAIPPASRREAIDRVLEACGLEKMSRRIIGKLSKGYRQRTGLAQAIIHNPGILILDEPTAGLDPNQIIEVRRLIKNLGKEKTLILSTHILQEVEALCDRILILNEGLIAAEGTPEEIAARMRGGKQYKLTLRSKAPLSREELSTIPGLLSVESFTETSAGIYDAALSLETETQAEGGDILFDWAVAKGLGLRSLTHERYSIETLFSRLTSEDGAAENPVRDTQESENA